MIEHLVIKALAVFFFVSAWLSILQNMQIHETITNAHITAAVKAKGAKDAIIWEHSFQHIVNTFLNRKPWNCGFCMSFWIGCLLYIIPIEFCYIPAIAGIASLLFSLKNRLETLIA